MLAMQPFIELSKAVHHNQDVEPHLKNIEDGFPFFAMTNDTLYFFLIELGILIRAQDMPKPPEDPATSEPKKPAFTVIRD